MVEENKIMLTDLDNISDPRRREWVEKRQKMNANDKELAIFQTYYKI
jgi:hypothetical protein